ncbi:MAG: T9SS type A sorting domain-containing protein, partial [Gemmatimonadota bacterium]
GNEVAKQGVGPQPIPEALIGTWMADGTQGNLGSGLGSLSMAGWTDYSLTLNSDGTYEVSGNNIYQGGVISHSGTFTVDATASPAQIDLNIEESNSPAFFAVGESQPSIYELINDDETMKINFGSSQFGVPRPTDFTPGNELAKEVPVAAIPDELVCTWVADATQGNLGSGMGSLSMAGWTDYSLTLNSDGTYEVSGNNIYQGGVITHSGTFTVDAAASPAQIDLSIAVSNSPAFFAVGESQPSIYELINDDETMKINFGSSQFGIPRPLDFTPGNELARQGIDKEAGDIVWVDDFSDGDYTADPPWWIWEDGLGYVAGKAKVEDGSLILYDPVPDPINTIPFNLVFTVGDTLNKKYTGADFYLSFTMNMTPNDNVFMSEMPHVYLRTSLDQSVWYYVVFAPRGSLGAGIYLRHWLDNKLVVSDPLIQTDTELNVAIKVHADTICCSVYDTPAPPCDWDLTYVIPPEHHVPPESIATTLTIGGWYLNTLSLDNVVYRCFGPCCLWETGDANGDGAINVLDALAVVNHILETQPLDEMGQCRADCNKDGVINVLDVLGIVNVILGIGTCPPAGTGKAVHTSAVLGAGEISGQTERGFELPIFAKTDVPIAGAQLKLKYDADAFTPGAPQLRGAWTGMRVASKARDGELAVVIYSTEGRTLRTGAEPFVSVPFMSVKAGQTVQSARLEFVEALLAATCTQVIPVDIQPIRLKSHGLLPETWDLSQNCPNPFNPRTDIRYQIAESRSPIHTSLKIFNLLGQEVRTLVDDVREPGYYTVTWDGRDSFGHEVASGVYFYQLQTGDFTAAKKMVLMK